MHSDFHRSLGRSSRSLFVLAAAMCLAPLAARAQTQTPGDPNAYISTRARDSLEFAAPMTQVVTLNAFVTTVIGKLNGGTIYDQVFDLPATSSSVR